MLVLYFGHFFNLQDTGYTYMQITLYAGIRNTYCAINNVTIVTKYTRAIYKQKMKLLH